MTYELDGKDYTDVVTKDYYYTAYLNRGAVLLNTYNFHQKYAYNFEISNNKVEIRGQAYSEDYSSQELTSLDSANKFLILMKMKILILLELEIPFTQLMKI